jgi:Zn-dependent metalloprotease
MQKMILLVVAMFASTISIAQANNAPAVALNAAEAYVAGKVSILPQGNILQARDSFVDELGQAHIRYQHVYKSIPVFESEAIVHINLTTGAVIGFTDALLPFAAIEVRPDIGASAAHGKALQHFQLGQGLGGRDDLMLLVNNGVASLSWRIRIIGEGAHGPIDKIAFIGARKGEVLRSWDNLETTEVLGTGNGFFNKVVELTTDKTTNYRLKDPTRGNQLTCDMLNRQANCYYMDDADNKWGDGTLSNRQSVAVDAQYGTAVTWDYFKNIHGRKGIADDNKGANNRVHYGRSYNNAFWSDSCFCMTYGDGDGITFNPFDSLDVAGHEMSHGVTSRTAKLTYSGESGGLNEATSDIFGTMVEYYANNSNDTPDYLIGEKLYKSGTNALRSMYRPSLDGKSADCWYSGLGSLDVHYSSGVANHFYYILAEGTTPSNGPNSPVCMDSDISNASGTASIAGIGRSSAEKIWYRALTVYMTSATNYAGARAATLKAAADLFPGSTAEYDAVTNAWNAVKVK